MILTSSTICYSSWITLSTDWTNPPIRVGKEILYKILVEAKDHLKEDGEVYFVINKDQGAKTVAKYLENYYLVTVVAKNKGFYIINLKNQKM